MVTFSYPWLNAYVEAIYYFLSSVAFTNNSR